MRGHNAPCRIKTGTSSHVGRTKSRRPRSSTISWLFGRIVHQSEAWQQQKRILYRLPLAASFQQIIDASTAKAVWLSVSAFSDY
jgi:hypothetical protein